MVGLHLTGSLTLDKLCNHRPSDGNDACPAWIVFVAHYYLMHTTVRVVGKNGLWILFGNKKKKNHHLESIDGPDAGCLVTQVTEEKLSAIKGERCSPSLKQVPLDPGTTQLPLVSCSLWIQMPSVLKKLLLHLSCWEEAPPGLIIRLGHITSRKKQRGTPSVTLNV